MLKHLPNAITLINLLCGCCGIVSCLHNQTEYVPVFMGVALLADFADGFIARALKVKSEIGAQLDSLADMITFGVLPGMMIFSMLQYHVINNLFMDFSGLPMVSDISKIPHGTGFFVRLNNFSNRAIPFVGFIYSLFACLRLAKFNLDDRQTVNFLGMPTPAGAIFVLGLYLNLFSVDFLLTPLYHPVSLLLISLLLSVLMVIELPMFSLKFSNFEWKGNGLRYIFLLLAIPQLFIFKTLALSTIILTYIALSFWAWFKTKVRYSE